MQDAAKKTKFRPIAYLFFLTVAFAFSFVFSSAYRLGDQVFYRDLYSNLAAAGINEIPYLQLFYTGSSEPLYGLIAWVGAQLSIDKEVYFSGINSLFCLVLLHLLRKNSATVLYVVLVFLNFYLFVLLGPAERLKTALLFTIMGAMVASRQARYGLLIAAFLCHFQTFILIGSRIAGLASRISVGHFLKKKTASLIFVGGPALFILSAWFVSRFSDALISKFESYRGEHGVSSIFDIAILMLISLIILKRKFEALLTLSATGVAASLLGAERINMIAFMLFSYFAVSERRTGHPIVIAIMIYFAIKGLIFAGSVFMYGTGF